jgi:MTH538 TIR-like domain (DUF1863)
MQDSKKEEEPMPTNVFVSFDHDDQLQVQGLKLLKHNPNHPLEFRDHSLKEPVVNRAGKPVTHSPSDDRSKPVRDEIKRKFENASKLVVLIGSNSHESEWIDWEIKTFFNMKKPLSGENTWKRIRGMRLKGSGNAATPPALVQRSVNSMDWDPEALDKWLDQNPDA